MKPKVLITDYVHNDLIEGLELLGYQSIYDPSISLNEIKGIIQEYHGIVINSKVKMTQEMIDLATSLKFIARLGSGLEIIDLNYAASKSIAVFNSPEGNRNAVAEHAVGLILAVANNFIRGDQEVKSRQWDRESNRGIELEGKTIGIVGFGNAGSALARKFKNWDMNIIAHDKYLDHFGDDFDYVEKVSLGELASRSDIISFHLPLSDETKHIAQKSFFEQCRQGVIIINTSRGQVVHTQDLIDYIDSGKVFGAGLDVFENEKPLSYCREESNMYEKLYNLQRIILSPHVAGWTHLSLKKIAKVLLNKITVAKLHN